MKVLKVQPTQVKYTNGQVASRPNTPPTKPQPTEPVSFKGSGSGALIGLAGGTIATVLTVGLVAITGGLALPGIVATAAITGGATAGAIAGDKIEDKINNSKDKANTKKFDING